MSEFQQINYTFSDILEVLGSFILEHTFTCHIERKWYHTLVSLYSVTIISHTSSTLLPSLHLPRAEILIEPFKCVQVSSTKGGEAHCTVPNHMKLLNSSNDQITPRRHIDSKTINNMGDLASYNRSIDFWDAVYVQNSHISLVGFISSLNLDTACNFQHFLGIHVFHLFAIHARCSHNCKRESLKS